MIYDIIIIGGGISGLYSAYKLKQISPDTTYLILEKNKILGGRYHNDIFYNTNLSANYTCNITNLPTTSNRAYGVTLILVQGSTGYYANALQIAGSSTSILWANTSTPLPTANKTEIQSFTLYYSGSSWTAMASYTSFG